MDFDRLNKVTWYPGHMRKAERELKDKLGAVDLVIDLVDARAPMTTFSYRLRDLVGDKARLRVLGKSDLADEVRTREWQAAFRGHQIPACTIHHKQEQQIPKMIQLLLKTAREDPRSRYGRLAYKRPMRAMVIGLPNVGKSTLINALFGGKRARTGPSPGVTRSQQWVQVNRDIELLDTPGIMFPNIADPRDGLNLGLLAMLKQDIVSDELLAEYLLYLLHQQERHEALKCYELEALPEKVGEMLEQIGQRLGYRATGGDVDHAQAAGRLMRDFREGKLGRISLEAPGSFAEESW